MIRRKLKTFTTYQEASEYRTSLFAALNGAFHTVEQRDAIQIRRKRKTFDVVERIAGTRKETKPVEQRYTKPKKVKRKRNEFIEYRLHEEDQSVLGR